MWMMAKSEQYCAVLSRNFFSGRYNWNYSGTRSCVWKTISFGEICKCDKVEYCAHKQRKVLEKISFQENSQMGSKRFILQFNKRTCPKNMWSSQRMLNKKSTAICQFNVEIFSFSMNIGILKRTVFWFLVMKNWIYSVVSVYFWSWYSFLDWFLLNWSTSTQTKEFASQGGFNGPFVSIEVLWVNNFDIFEISRNEASFRFIFCFHAIGNHIKNQWNMIAFLQKWNILLLVGFLLGNLETSMGMFMIFVKCRLEESKR